MAGLGTNVAYLWAVLSEPWAESLAGTDVPVGLLLTLAVFFAWERFSPGEIQRHVDFGGDRVPARTIALTVLAGIVVSILAVEAVPLLISILEVSMSPGPM